MNYRALIGECINKGWVPNRITGGHLIMTKDNKRSVPIPIHKNKLPDSVILKQLDQDPPSKSIKLNEHEQITEKVSTPKKSNKSIKKVETNCITK